MISLNDFYRAETAAAQSSGYNRDNLFPGIVHIGVGGFHRAHMARYQELYNRLATDRGWSITGVGLLPADTLFLNRLKDQDGLYTLLEADQDTTSIVTIGSIRQLISADENPQLAIDVMASENTKIISTTITEGGYLYDFERNCFLEEHPLVKKDLENPDNPASLFGYLRLALRQRSKSLSGPVTLMSCDNVPGNGDVFKEALFAFLTLAEETELLLWLEENASFPNSMVDRITPTPPSTLKDRIQQDFGVNDNCAVIAEPFTQWVIEDKFISGRPDWDKVGAQFTTRVESHEQLKIRILNGTHILISQIGYLQGFQFIHELMTNPEISTCAKMYMTLDAKPTITDFTEKETEDYISCIVSRFSNPEVQDSVQRVATDGFHRLKNFLMPVIRHQIDRGIVSSRMALAFACFLKKLSGKDINDAEIDVIEPNLSEIDQVRFSKNPELLLRSSNFFGSISNPHVEDFCAEVKHLRNLLDAKPLPTIIKELRP